MSANAKLIFTDGMDRPINTLILFQETLHTVELGDVFGTRPEEYCRRLQSGLYEILNDVTTAYREAVEEIEKAETVIQEG